PTETPTRPLGVWGAGVVKACWEATMTSNVRVALVTGGGSGIGRGISLRLARSGIPVAVLDVDRAGAEQTREQIAAAGGRAAVVSADVADPAAVRRGVEEARAALGPAHILVNVAGIGAFAPLLEMRQEDWDRMIAVHLTGTF